VDDYDAGIQQANFYAQTKLAFSPEIMFNASAEWKLYENLSLTWNFRHVGSQFLDNTGDPYKSLDAFWINDVRADATIMNKRSMVWTAFVAVNNLFSEKYEPNGYSFSYISGNTLYRDRYYFPMATANFMLGMHIQWNYR
jgi:iron complex outermembrane receptor protein